MISASMRVKFDPRKAKRQLQDAITKGIEMSMFVWETAVKMITTTENHVLTGRYRASLNRSTGDGLNHGSQVPESKSGDGLHEKISWKELRGGSNVEYALSLEKSFALMSRALDTARGDMLKLFVDTVAKNT